MDVGNPRGVWQTSELRVAPAALATALLSQYRRDRRLRHATIGIVLQQQPPAKFILSPAVLGGDHRLSTTLSIADRHYSPITTATPDQ